SGFLITSLLLEENATRGRIALGAFWGRRARRLLPALFLVLGAVSLYAVINGRFSSPTSGGAAIDLSGLRGDALATLVYVANWHAIFSHQSYFTQFSTPSPLTHTWSLAIEEQFYLLWPLAIVGLVTWAKAHWRGIGLGVCVGGAAASALAMALLYHPGVDPSRVYYGTDTRAFDLLVGAALAFATAARPQPGPRARRALHGVSIPAVVVLGVFWATAGTAAGLPRPAMFHGEFLLCALLAGVVLADVRQVEAGPLARVLSIAPLRYIGTISYGLYLWHWPVFVYLNSARTSWHGAGLDLARIGLTAALAVASYHLVERPLRRASFAGIKARLAIPAAVLATVGVILVGTTASVAAPVEAWTGGGLDPGAGPAVAGAGGFGTEVPIALPPTLHLSPKHPLRVLTFGDSVMSFAQKGIISALESTGEVRVEPAARPGWSLKTSSGLAFLEHHVRLSRPELVVGTWSWDNVAAKRDPNAYQKKLDAAIRQLLVPHDHVLGVIFLQMPVFNPDTSTPEGRGFVPNAAGLAIWNAAVQQASGLFPGKVMYLPVASSLEIEGRYTNWLPPTGSHSAPLRHWVRVRTSDGVHLCPPGITRYAAPVLQDLTELFHLKPTPRHWWLSQLITVRGLAHATSSFGVTCPTDHPPT
ncbi:MAG TPA: acyltransferase family protein, partial [Acidimicrobiales bacterium]